MEEKGEENGCHKELLLDNMRGRRALGHEGNLKVTDDLIMTLQSSIKVMIFISAPHSGQGTGFTS